jgi:hypothetical protein
VQHPKWPLLAAASVFIAGFGALGTIWAAGEWEEGQPGFPDYLSGTVGDAVLLPTLVYLLAWSRGRVLDAVSRSPSLRRSTLYASLGAVPGAAVMASWLLDEEARLNWSLPEPGVFSLAGWWHAVFLVLVCALLSEHALVVMLGLRHMRSTAAADHAAYVRSPLVPCVSAVAVAFCGLAVYDSLPSAATSASISTIAAVSAAAIIAIATFMTTAGAFSLGVLFRMGLGITCGFLLSIAIILASGNGFDGLALLAALMVGVGLGECVWRHYDSAARLFIFPVLTAGVPLLVQQFGVTTGLISGLVAAAIVAPTVVLLFRTLPLTGPALPLRRRVEMVTVTAGAALFAALVLTWEQAERELALLDYAPIAVTIAFEWVFFSLIQSIWTEYTALQEDVSLRSHSSTASNEQVNFASHAYLAAMPLGVGLVTLLVLTVQSAIGGADAGRAVALGRYVLDEQLGWTAAISALLLLLSCGAPVARMLQASPFAGDSPIDKATASRGAQLVQLGALGVLAFASLAASMGLLPLVRQGLPMWAVFFLLIQLSLLSLDTYESPIVNCCFLAYRLPSAVDHAVSALATIATAGVTLLGLYWGALTARTATVAVIALAVVAIVRLAICVCSAAIIYSRSQSHYGTDYPPFFNMLQDEALRMLLASLVVWFPAYGITHFSQDAAVSAGVVLTVLFAAYVPLTPVFFWSCQQNLRHFFAQRRIRWSGSNATIGGPSSVTGPKAVISLLGLYPRLRTTAGGGARFVTALGFHLSFQIVVRGLVAVTAIAPAVLFAGAGVKSAVGRDVTT